MHSGFLPSEKKSGTFFCYHCTRILSVRQAHKGCVVGIKKRPLWHRAAFWVLRVCGRALKLFLVETRSRHRVSKGGFRALALILSAHSAEIRIVTYGPERVSGLCPENPQPFEKGWRKLYFACERVSDAGFRFSEYTRIPFRR